jgi:hypothetical protein
VRLYELDKRAHVLGKPTGELNQRLAVPLACV